MHKLLSGNLILAMHATNSVFLRQIESVLKVTAPQGCRIRGLLDID